MTFEKFLSQFKSDASSIIYFANKSRHIPVSELMKYITVEHSPEQIQEIVVVLADKDIKPLSDDVKAIICSANNCPQDIISMRMIFSMGIEHDIDLVKYILSSSVPDSQKTLALKTFVSVGDFAKIRPLVDYTFSKEQLDAAYLIIINGCSVDLIKACVQTRFTADQMERAKICYRAHLPDNVSDFLIKSDFKKSDIGALAVIADNCKEPLKLLNAIGDTNTDSESIAFLANELPGCCNISSLYLCLRASNNINELKKVFDIIEHDENYPGIEAYNYLELSYDELLDIMAIYKKDKEEKRETDIVGLFNNDDR